jgi:glycosyltransferase involved in cell wall biosynthesis
MKDIPAVRKWARERLQETGSDLVHVHLFHALVIVGSLPAGPSIRVLTHHHGDFLTAQRRRFEAALDRRFGRRFDRVVAVSDAVRDFLVARYSYPSERVITIRNGWEGEIRPPSPHGASTVVSVGNLRPEKGHSVLLRAVAELGDARLVIVGDGPLRSSLEREARSLGLADRVEFAGAVSDVWPYLARADVFVFPSLSEPLGIAVMEAMAAGLPVVASAVGGIPELVTDGVTGYLAPPGDHAALSVHLKALLGDPGTRASMGAAARARAEDFKMERTVDGYFELYDTLLERGR